MTSPPANSDTAVDRPSPKLMLVAFSALAPSLLAILYLSQANENFQIGMDFRLTYTVAVAWAQGEDPYDDRVLKKIWAGRGMPQATPPGLPQTPNVYPLTVAPLLWPLALLQFPTALALWLWINAACLAILLLQLLTTPKTGPALPIFAACIFLLGFPLQYGFSFGNLAVLTTFLMVQALRSSHRPLWSGVLLGLALVKYSLCAPLLLYLAVTRRWKTAAIAGATQAAMIAIATCAGPFHSPVDWLRPMLATAGHSLQPGQPNHHAALQYTALHLELPALLYRISSHLDRWGHAAVALLIATLVVALVRSRRRSCDTGVSPRSSSCGTGVPPVSSPCGTGVPPVVEHQHHHACPGFRIGPEEIAILAVTLLAFYHRTYDLIVVVFPLLTWLVWAHHRLPVHMRLGLWAAAAMTALPGATSHGGSPDVGWFTLAFVQPAAIWALLIVAILVLTHLLRRPPPTSINAL